MKQGACTKFDSWLFKRRGGYVLLAFLCFFVCLPALAGFRQTQFRAKCGSGYLAKQVNDPIPAKRGCILDRCGRVIAGCEARYEIFANPRLMMSQDADTGKVTKLLCSNLGLDDDTVRAELQKDSVRVVLCPTSTPEQREILKALKAADKTKYLLKEVGIERLYERTYPGQGMPGNVLGWVRREGCSLIGVEGLEMTLDYLLRGHDGLRTGVRGLNGLPLATGYRVIEEAVDGNDILLTLDRGIHQICYDRLTHWVQKTGALRGAAVVVEAGSGDLLAVAQYPCIEPHNYRRCVDNGAARDDFACRCLFEPGSIGKAFVAAAGIDEGIIKPQTTFYVDCPPIHIDGYPVGEYHPIWDKPGRRSLEEIVVNSSNIGMSRVGLALGDDVVVAALHRFGFASQPNLNLLGMPDAIVPEVGDHLCAIETANSSFGQGYAITPVQVALAFNALASRGTFNPGRLIYGVRDGVSGMLRLVDRPESRRAVDPESCRLMVDILHKVTVEGTGKRAAPEGYRVAGKTGTAQVPSPDGGYYKDSEDYYIVSFAGFGPLPDPRYTIVVVIEKPRGGEKYDSGGKAAAPCFREIFSAIMDLDRRRGTAGYDFPGA